MDKIISEKLKSLRQEYGRVKADHVWVKQTKLHLLSQMEEKKSEEKQFDFSGFVAVFMPKYAIQMARPVLAILLVISMTVGGWIAGVSASYKSLPGDVLYGVKLATEKTQVALASVSDKGTEAQLHLEFAGRRTEEVKKVIEKNEPESKKQAGEAMDSLQKSISSAKEAVKAVGEKDLATAVNLAQDVSNKTSQITNDLKEVNKTVVKDVELSKKVTETTAAVKKTELETIENVVEKVVVNAQLVPSDTAQAAENKANGEKVTALVVGKITDVSKEAVEEATALKDFATSTKVLIESSDIKTVSSTLDEAPSNIVSTTTLETVLTVDSQKLKEEVKSMISDVAKKADETKGKTDSILEHAKELTGKNHLLEAIQKVKEVNEVNKEAAKAVVDAKEVVKQAVENQVVDKKAVEAVSTQANIVLDTAKTIQPAVIQPIIAPVPVQNKTAEPVK
jgi:hypothetical protein